MDGYPDSENAVEFVAVLRDRLQENRLPVGDVYILLQTVSELIAEHERNRWRRCDEEVPENDGGYPVVTATGWDRAEWDGLSWLTQNGDKPIYWQEIELPEVE